MLEAAAVRGEVVVSVARIVFCSLILARYFTIVEPVGGVVGIWMTSLTVSACIGMSIAVLVLARRERLPGRWIVFSPLMDALVCGLTLLPNVVWPVANESGLLHKPETAIVLVVVFAAGFRLHTAAAVLGGIANIVCICLLLALDYNVGGARWNQVGDATLYLLALVGCAALTVVTARRTRRLVLQAAAQARRSQRAEDGLSSLMAEHHDMRAVLSAASINSSVVLRALDGGGAVSPELGEVARDLREDLREASRAILRVKQQAYAELTTLTDVVKVDVGHALKRVVAANRRRFSHVEIAYAPVEDHPTMAVVGGVQGFERIVGNLLVNACEGDGVSVATRVEVMVETGPDRVTLIVGDNGPGFPPTALFDSQAGYPTTKPEGSGLGLLMVEGLVRASGGQIVKDNQPSGGARVRVVLPAESPRD